MQLGEVLRQLALHGESRVEEGHLLADDVHMLVSIPPKDSEAQVIGCLKGKSAIHIAREFADRPRNFVGQHFWARGYFVSTVGRDEQVIRESLLSKLAFEDSQLGQQPGARSDRDSASEPPERLKTGLRPPAALVARTTRPVRSIWTASARGRRCRSS